MAKDNKDMPRTDVGKEGMPHEKPGDGGKTGGELGKQGGLGEKKEWEKGGQGSSNEPGRTGGMGDKAPER